MPHVGHMWAKLLDLIGEFAGIQQHDRRGVLDQPLQLGGSQPPVEILQDRADLAAGHPHVEVGQRVGGVDGDAVTRPHTQIAQIIRGLVDLRIPGGVSDIAPGEGVANGEPLGSQLSAPL